MINPARQFDGEIRNLRAEPTFGGLRFSFVHAGIVAEQRFRYAVTLDGDLVMLLGTGETSGRIDGVPPGEHRLEVWPLREDVVRLPDFHGTAYGRRAYVRWARVADGDVRAYAVYTDGGTGTVDFAEPVAVVTELAVVARWGVLPDDGLGSGRISIGGGWRGDEINAAFTVEVTGLGTGRHNLRGAWETFPFERGVGVYLPGGPVVTFEDPADSYEVGDEWAVEVGPRTTWSSGDLAEGTHQFAVAARDAAGNEGDASDTVGVVIIHRPPPVEGLRGVWRPELGEIHLTWVPPAGIDAVLLFSNFSVMFEELRPEVIETGPWVTLAADAEGYIFDPASALGVWRFYVRTRDAAGRLSESIELVEVDTSALPEGVALNEPDSVAVTAAAGGMLRVSWGYRLERGEDVESFAVYEADDPLTAVATVSAVGAGPWAAYAVEVGPYGGATSFVVGAIGAGAERYSAAAEGVPDAVAPGAPSDILGVAN